VLWPIEKLYDVSRVVQDDAKVQIACMQVTAKWTFAQLSKTAFANVCRKEPTRAYWVRRRAPKIIHTR
jgi:hypothetical protein